MTVIVILDSDITMSAQRARYSDKISNEDIWDCPPFFAGSARKTIPLMALYIAQCTVYIAMLDAI